MEQTIALLLEWIQHHRMVVWWTGFLSVFVFLGFLIAVPIIIKLPADHFQRHSPAKQENDESLPFSHVMYVIFKNIAGIIFALVGIAMLFLPGQGLFTLIIGLSLLSIPGKQCLVLKIVRQKNALDSLNRLRAKFDKQPFTIYP